MGQIASSDVRGLFTKMLLDVYKEITEPTSFLRSFYKTKESSTKTLSIEVQRNSEKIAVDVARGTEGNRNTWDISTEKIFQPPFYREFFDATHLDLYDRLFTDQAMESGVFADFLQVMAEKLKQLQNKIERSYEKQASEVFETGVVQLQAGINIDFKRKALSLVDKGAGFYWKTGTVDPNKDLEAAANFIRKEGKSSAGTLTVIMGSTAWTDYLNNTIVKERADIRNFKLDDLVSPQKGTTGGTFHGQVAGGSYRFNIWTYPQFFENTSGTLVDYINPKKIIVVPEITRYTLGFAAVPQLVTKTGGRVRKGAFIVDDYIDERNVAHIFDMKSAGIAIPVAVDTIHTTQVVA